MPEAVARYLPESVQPFVEKLLSPGVLIALAVISIVSFVASLVGVPYFLTRLPVDYFSRHERQVLGLPLGTVSRPRRAFRVLKNLFGLVLLLLGILMLVLPGQAILTLLVALFFLDFPGKHRLERWVVRRPLVLRSINALRRRAGREPLEPRTSWLPPSSSLPPGTER